MASISFSYAYTSGNTDYYNYTATAGTGDFSYPSGSCDQTGASASGTVACGTFLTVSLTGKYHTAIRCGQSGFWSYTGSIDVSGTSPSCPPPPPPTYPPSWSDNSLAGFQAETAYSDGVSATNMSYSGSYSVSAGSLPSGISLNTSSGAVTGTPTTAFQTYSFTIQASNSYGTITTSFSGTVADSPTHPPVWSDSSLAAFTVGEVYSDSVTATNMSYSGSYSVSSGSLPAGISLNTSSGAVTGTPTTAGPYSFTLTATNTYNSVSQGFSGSVKGGASIYDGLSWVKGTAKVYDGTDWIPAPVKIYNGSSWVVSN